MFYLGSQRHVEIVPVSSNSTSLIVCYFYSCVRTLMFLLFVPTLIFNMYKFALVFVNCVTLSVINKHSFYFTIVRY